MLTQRHTQGECRVNMKAGKGLCFYKPRDTKDGQQTTRNSGKGLEQILSLGHRRNRPYAHLRLALVAPRTGTPSCDTLLCYTSKHTQADVKISYHPHSTLDPYISLSFLHLFLFLLILSIWIFQSFCIQTLYLCSFAFLVPWVIYLPLPLVLSIISQVGFINFWPCHPQWFLLTVAGSNGVTGVCTPEASGVVSAFFLFSLSPLFLNGFSVSFNVDLLCIFNMFILRLSCQKPYPKTIRILCAQIKPWIIGLCCFVCHPPSCPFWTHVAPRSHRGQC